MITVLLVIHSILVLFLIGIILIQRSDGDGMGSLGGGGGNNFLTGRAQANLLTRTTAILATLFIVSSLGLAIWSGNMRKGSIVDAIPAAPASEAPADKTAPAKAEKKEKVAPEVPKPE